MKKSLIIVLALLMSLTLFSGCEKKDTGNGEEPNETVQTTVRLGLIKGPTGMGASYLLEKSEKGETVNIYETTLANEPSDMIAMVANGSVDIAAVPTNSASALYNKTSGGVQLLALNTGCVLKILEQGETIDKMSDLKGRTIYATGQGANPEYILNYMLEQYGLKAGEDVTVEYLDSAELTTKAASGEIDLCMLPVPAATTVLMKNDKMRLALSLEEEWNHMNRATLVTMGCVVVRREFAEANPQAVEAFLKEYGESINYVIENPTEGGKLCAKFEIVASDKIAEKAIEDAELIFIADERIPVIIKDYYQILFDADPKSVGGKLPGEDFYYTAQ